MGLMDHRKTWRYRVSASQRDVVQAFATAFSGGGGILARAKWSVQQSSTGAVAVYEGRKGLIAAVTMLSDRASGEQDSAIGSQIKFELEESGDGYVVFSMWLASRGTSMGMTSDGRFFRPYMRAVEDHLRRLDPYVQVEKS